MKVTSPSCFASVRYVFWFLSFWYFVEILWRMKNVYNIIFHGFFFVLNTSIFNIKNKTNKQSKTNLRCLLNVCSAWLQHHLQYYSSPGWAAFSQRRSLLVIEKQSSNSSSGLEITPVLMMEEMRRFPARQNNPLSRALEYNLSLQRRAAQLPEDRYWSIS